MKFSEALRKKMDDRGVTQSELCRMTGIATSAMSHYVNDDTDPSVSKAKAIAEALDCTLDELSGRVTYAHIRLDLDPDRDELVDIYDSITPEGRKQLMIYARGIAATYAKNNLDSGNKTA